MYPDLIIFNEKAVTFDANLPKASALALKNGRILAIGLSSDIRNLAGANTRIIDAADGSILPGFIDSHVHLFGGSVE